MGGGAPKKGGSKRALLILIGIMVAWMVTACCGTLPEERMREQTAFARRAGTPSAATPADLPTPSLTVTSRRDVPGHTPAFTVTPSRGVPGHTPTFTVTPSRGVQLNAPIETYIARPMTVTLHIPPDTQDLPLSCESSAAKMAAQYFKPTPPAGFTDWEWYFIRTIPRHCNPHRGYRGKIDGSLSISCRDPQGYGTYAEPIAKALNRAGVPARVEYGADYQRIAREIRLGRPVIVWMSRRDDAPMREFDPEILREYVLLLGEHVWLVVGVSADNASFLVNDPADGSQYWVKRFPRWEVFGGMSVVVGG